MRSALGMCVSRLTTASALRRTRGAGTPSSNTSASTALAPRLSSRSRPRAERVDALDVVACGEQLADGALPDDACGSGDHDLVHAGLTT